MSRMTALRWTCVVGLKIGNSMEGPLLVLALVLLAVLSCVESVGPTHKNALVL